MKIIVGGSGPGLRSPRLGLPNKIDLSLDSKDIRMFSSLIIKKAGLNVMIDCGDLYHILLRESIPKIDLLMLTHAHWDVIAGFYSLIQYLDEKNLDKPLVVCNEHTARKLLKTFPINYRNCKVLKVPNLTQGFKKFKWNGLDIMAFGVYHSRSVPTLGYRISESDQVLLYTPEAKFVRDLYFKDVKIWLADGSSLFKENYAHPTFKSILNKVKTHNIPSTFLTHIGHGQGLTHLELEKYCQGRDSRILPAYDGLFVDMDSSFYLIKNIKDYDPSKVSDTELRSDHRICHIWMATIKIGKKFKYSSEEVKRIHELIVKEIEARGMKHGTPMEESVTGTKTPGMSGVAGQILKVKPKIKQGIYVVEPHAKWIVEGQKVGIVKAKEFKETIDKPLILISGDWAYGVIRIFKPRRINIKQFKDLARKHQVSESERKKWWPRSRSLYYYELKIDKIYPKPKRVRVPQGIQTFIRDVKFLENFELIAYLTKGSVDEC